VPTGVDTAVRPRVLVVEDDDAVNAAIVDCLLESGMEVASAGTGLKAVEFLDGARFDVVLLDLVLPGMSGLEILRRLRSEGSRVPVVVVSGHVGLLDERRYRDLGACRVIHKPVDFSRLLATVRQVVRGMAE
jgi:DNA-binding response OmpR family regulator